MRIVAARHLLEYARSFPLTGPSLQHWLAITRAAHWTNTSDVLRTFRNAKTVTGERVRFEIAGGDHRLICAFHWRSRTCYIKFLGNHRDYDAVDARTASMF